MDASHESFPNLLPFSMLRQSPPTYGLALYSLDMIPSCFPWIALMRYNHKICPPDLVSTMVIYSSYTPCDSYDFEYIKYEAWALTIRTGARTGLFVM